MPAPRTTRHPHPRTPLVRWSHVARTGLALNVR